MRGIPEPKPVTPPDNVDEESDESDY